MSKLPNDIALKNAREYYDLKSSLDEFLKLKEKAFPFLESGTASYDTFNPLSVFVSYWHPLLAWHGLDTPHNSFEVEGLFMSLTNRDINMEEFKNRLSPTVTAIEEYAKNLEEKVTEKLCNLESLYKNFKGFTPELSFILEQSFIRDNFFKFLLSYSDN